MLLWLKCGFGCSIWILCFLSLSLPRLRVGSKAGGGRAGGNNQKKINWKFSTHIHFIEFCIWRTTAEFWLPVYFKFTSHMDFVCFVYKHSVEGKLEKGRERMVGHICALQQMYFNSYGRPGTLIFFLFSNTLYFNWFFLLLLLLLNICLVFVFIQRTLNSISTSISCLVALCVSYLHAYPTHNDSKKLFIYFSNLTVNIVCPLPNCSPLLNQSRKLRRFKYLTVSIR